MTVLHISIERKKELAIRFDLLAREDATDEELEWARAVQESLIAVMQSMPGTKTTRKDKGDGHTKIRGVVEASEGGK